MSMVMTRSAISVISCIRFVIVELVGDGEECGELKVEVFDKSPIGFPDSYRTLIRV